MCKARALLLYLRSEALCPTWGTRVLFNTAMNRRETIESRKKGEKGLFFEYYHYLCHAFRGNANAFSDKRTNTSCKWGL